MPAKMAAWRSNFATHRRLYLDLLMILGSCLVCGLFFSEQWHNQSSAERQQSLNALAVQLANDSYVPLAGNNLVSLNVLTSQLVAQPPVMGVRIERLDGSVASSAGESSSLSVMAPVSADASEVIGRVRIYSEPLPALPVWSFLLLLILLLGLRMVLDLFWKQLVPFSSRTWLSLREGRRTHEEKEAEPPMAIPLAEARLDLRVASFEKLEQRFTPTALSQLLNEYTGLVRKVAQVYDATGELSLANGRAVLLLHHEDESEAMFHALCCAKLLVACTQLLSQQRQKLGDGCLTLGMLASLSAPEALRDKVQGKALNGVQLLLAGDVSTLTPWLTLHLLEQWQEENQRWQLFTDIELTERYRTLVTAQCSSLMETDDV